VSKLLWFIGIFGTIIIVLAYLGIWVEKSNQRREIDPVYDEKVIRRMSKTDPYYKFLFNLFGWALALFVFYYFYLG
jgi:cellobiose-specific phosphotransferase system component IIC